MKAKKTIEKGITRKEIRSKIQDSVNLTIKELAVDPSKKVIKVVQKASKKIASKVKRDLKKIASKKNKSSKKMNGEKHVVEAVA